MVITIAQKEFTGKHVNEVYVNASKNEKVLQLGFKGAALDEVNATLSTSDGTITVLRDGETEPVVFTGYNKVTTINRSLTDYEDVVNVELARVVTDTEAEEV